jgi:Ca2+-binding EF-hand superfamily protein
MRKILVTFFFFATCVTLALAQRPGGGGFGGKGGGGFGGTGGGGFNMDPNQIFDRYAQGQAQITIANVSGFGKAPLEEFAKQHNITSGQITRAQFADYWSNKDKYRTAGSGGMGKQRGGGFSGGPGGMTPGAPPTVPGAPAVNPIEAINLAAEADFKRRDQNGDGYLNFDEMPRTLREQIERWDLNGDNLISLDEFRQYYAARMGMRGGLDAEPAPITIIIEDDLDKRPTVFRAGKLPKELPKWFKELDSDRDGQVAFHEWRHGGKDLDEFKDWDRNDDGFITAEEVLSKLRVEAVAKANLDAAEGNESSASEEGGGFAKRMKKNRFDGEGGGGGKKSRGGFGSDAEGGGGKKSRAAFGGGGFGQGGYGQGGFGGGGFGEGDFKESRKGGKKGRKNSSEE